MRRSVVALVVLALVAVGGWFAVFGSDSESDSDSGPSRKVDADSGGPKGSGLSWSYDEIFAGGDTGHLSDVIATAADDIWVAGNVTPYEGDAADDGFLLHYDGTAWQRRPMPAALGASVHEARFDAVDSGGFLLTASLRSRDAPRMAHWDGERWTALPALPDGHRAADVRAFAADDIWAVDGESGAYHWDGAGWTFMDLPATVSALDGVAPDDLWAVGHRDIHEGNSGQATEWTQPAAMHWDGSAWKLVETPEYHFPEPVPPEPSADLEKVVAQAPDDIRAYGEHTFNHGEVYDEPADGTVRLRWDGTRWKKLPDVKGACADRSSPVRDGERGMLLSDSRYLTAEGECVKISFPRLPSSDVIQKDSRQSLWLEAMEPVPGTDDVLGVGHVDVNQAGNPTSRTVIVSLKR